jgi:hypothetical protein
MQFMVQLLKTHYLKMVGANTFRAFNPTQAEETYSMVTANLSGLKSLV